MKPIRNFLFFLTLSIATVHADSENLPSDSKELLTKLELFEEETLEKAQEVIIQKRAAVSKILQSHLDRETRSGNLETALQLKRAIEGLSDPTKQLEQSPGNSEEKTMAEPDEETSLLEFLIGPVWSHTEGRDLTFEFKEDGTGDKFLGEAVNPQSFEWQLDDQVITVKFGPNTRYFAVDLQRKELWETSEDGNRRVEYSAKN